MEKHRPFMKSTCLKLFIAGLLVFMRIPVSAQPKPVLEWHKCLGSSYGEYPGSIQPTSDGGYIISGYSAGADGDVMGHHGNPTVGDIWIVKLDRSGNIEWQKSYGGKDSDAGAWIIQTADGGYILAGSSASRDCNINGNHGGFDYWILKLNSRGDVIWQKMYGGSQQDYVTSISIAADGGYFVAGSTLSTDGDVTGNHGQSDSWIIKIDASGKLVWQKTFGGSESDNAQSVQSTADGGCIVAANTYSSNGNVTGYHGGGDYWLIKLDKLGNLQWQKALGGSMTDAAASVQVTKDGGYIVSGYSNSADGDVTGVHGPGFDSWIVKLDGTGNINWQKCIGGTQNETANYIQNTPDGGYVFTGLSYSADGDVGCNAGIFDLFIVKMTNNGQLQWETTIGGQANDEGVCVQPLNDGSFIVLGYTESADVAGYHPPAANADGRSDYWIIKLSPPLASAPAPIVKIDPASAIVCAANPASFNASVLYAGVNPVYQWKRNGINVGTNSPQYSDINFAANDQISCVVHPGNICENNGLQGNDNIAIQLKVNGPDPTITIAADNTNLCECSTITIKATVTDAGGSPRYQWKINNNNAGTDAPILISTKLQNGDVVTCNYFDNTVCAPDGLVQSNAITFGGSGALSVTIIADADTVCKGTNVSFTANAINAGTNPVYQWKINNANAGSNSSVFTSTTLSDGDMVSCTVSPDPALTCAVAGTAISNNIKMHVVNNAAPAVSIAASAETICEGSSVNFTAAVTNAGVNPAYQWKINGVNTGTNDKNYTTSSLVNNDVISCTVTIDPLFSCALTNQASSQIITMTVNPGDPPAVTITADKNSACAGENITFSAETQYAGSNPGFEWILNDNVLSNQSPVFSNDQLRNGDRLFCRIIPGAGACSQEPDSSNIIVAAIKDTPVVHISPADTTISPGMQVQLFATVVGNTSSFQWTPAGKLINPLSLTPQTIALNESTVYELTVRNNQACQGTATAVVKVFTQLYVPSAFTPNDDGINDQFRIPPSNAITLKEFSIYNRWGTRVFSTTNIREGWDGNIRGKKQDTGVYVYYIKATVNEKEIFQKGNFVLIR